jgi:hypothetical protein
VSVKEEHLKIRFSKYFKNRPDFWLSKEVKKSRIMKRTAIFDMQWILN